MTEGATDAESGRRDRWWRSPALLVLLLAPFLGESLSGSTPPLTLLLPWNLVLMIALYGCGALICREVAHRFGLGVTGLLLLGAAYAVWEEGLVDRYWFLPRFWTDSGVGGYSVVGHVNVLLAAHLTVFHTAVSIGTSVLVVEWLRPEARHRPWVGRPGLAVAGLALALTPLLYGELDQRPPLLTLVATAGLLVGCVVLAFIAARRSATSRDVRPRHPVRGLGLLVLLCAAAHWVLTYSVSHTGLPWPSGTALAVLPLGLGVIAVRRLATTGPYGHDAARVVAGLLVFFAGLDALLVVLGSYDQVISAAVALWLARTVLRVTRPSETGA